MKRDIIYYFIRLFLALPFLVVVVIFAAILLLMMPIFGLLNVFNNSREDYMDDAQNPEE